MSKKLDKMQAEIDLLRKQSRNDDNRLQMEIDNLEKINNFLIGKLTSVLVKDLPINNCCFCGCAPLVETEIKLVDRVWYNGNFDQIEQHPMVMYKISCPRCTVSPTTGFHQGLSALVKVWNGVQKHES